MASYLWLRGQTWFFQLRPPRDLRSILGTTPFRIRLPVQTHREASRFARHLAGSAERWLTAMRYTNRGLALEFNDDPNWTEEDRRKVEAKLRRPFIEALLAEVQEISRAAEQFDVYEKIKQFATEQDKEQIAKKQQQIFSKINDDWVSFASSLMKDYEVVFSDAQRRATSIQRTSQELESLNDEYYDDSKKWKEKLTTISDEAQKSESARQAAHEENTKTLSDVRDVLKNTTEITNRILYEGPLLSECWEEFVKAKRKHLPAGSTEPDYFERRIAAFLELVGDKQIAAYHIADLGDFADKLRHLPKRHTIDPEWRGKTLKQALDENKSRSSAERAETISYRTVKINYVGKIKTAIRWLSAKYKVKYPFEYDRVLIPKDLPTSTIRRGLDVERLNRLFRECVTDVHRKRPEDVWLPLLGYLTGARLGELVSLQPHNIRCEDGIYFADLTTRIADKEGVRNRKIKNRDSLRLFALHEKLEDVGFIKWVEGQRDAGHDYLFPALHESSRPQRNATSTDKPKVDRSNHIASKRFQRLFQKLEFGRTYVFHSLRHSFKDWTRTRGVAERTIALQAGHSLDGIALRYGSRILRSDELRQIASLPLMEKLDLEMFKGVAKALRPQPAIQKFTNIKREVPEINVRAPSIQPESIPDVRSLRIGMGLTQQQFADRFGFSAGALRDWEQGRTRPGRFMRAQISAIAANPEYAALGTHLVSKKD